MRGKEVTDSMLYSPVSKSHCGKARMTGHEGNEVIGSVQCWAVNECHCVKASMTVHEGK